MPVSKDEAIRQTDRQTDTLPIADSQKGRPDIISMKFWVDHDLRPQYRI